MTITQDELGRRIRQAREACELTQGALGEQSGLARSAIVQIEQGKRAVSSLELDRLAYVLGRDLREFFAPEFEAPDTLVALFRADRELMSQTDVAEALRHTLALRREMANLERLLGIDRLELVAPAYPVPPPGKAYIATHQGERVAEQERRRLGLGANPVGEPTELLDSQGIPSATVDLPDNVSGLTLPDAEAGVFVVVNRRHHLFRRRFSAVHEYGHVLMDRERLGVVSRAENHEDLLEVRANAFAAAFLMPAEGVRQFILGLGKGQPSKGNLTVFDEEAPVEVAGRVSSGSQEIQIYDVARLAHHYGVSRQSVLYRLKNLKLVGEAAFQRLWAGEERGQGKAVAELLDLPEPDHRAARDEFRHRFLGLALEAYRREEITRAKLTELALLVGLDRNRIESLLESASLDDAA